MTSQPSATSSASLVVDHATLGYDRRTISTGLSVSIPDNSFTVLVGPNACGKSTLLRALARILKPNSGDVRLDGRNLDEYKSKDLAKLIGLLPQTAIAPDGIKVADLVSRGRHPHHSPLRQWSVADDQAVARALGATGTAELADRYVDELSGGQRQRVWIALLLAQQTPMMLLDEPTTYLDIAHQYELLELLRDFHDEGKTIVAVLHDLNQAARYASHLIVMKDGNIVATGRPQDVITADLVGDVFGLKSVVVPDPVTGTPTVVPLDPRRERAE